MSQNVVRFVLKRGPFCASRGPFLLAVVRFVMTVVRFIRGPFCPWSVMSLIRLMQVHRTKSKYQLHNEIGMSVD